MLFMIQISTLETYAQEKTPERIEYKNSITYNLFGLFSRKAIIGYERNLNKRNILRIAAGVKYPTSAESYQSRSFGPLVTKNYKKVSQGKYLSLGYKYILSDYSRIYLSLDAYYYHIYFDNIYYQFCVGTSMDSYVSLESMWTKTKGINIIFGKKLRVLSGKKVGLEFDFFAGTGIAIRTQELTTHAKLKGTCSINADLFEFDPPSISNSEDWIITMNLGVLITMPFVQKK